MKKTFNYFIMILILVGMNLTFALVRFLLFERNWILDYIIYYSIIPSFILITLVLAKFIKRQSLSIYISVAILCFFIFINLFFGEIMLIGALPTVTVSVEPLYLIEENISCVSMLALNEFVLRTFTFPIFQPLAVFCVYKIMNRKSKNNCKKKVEETQNNTSISND